MLISYVLTCLLVYGGTSADLVTSRVPLADSNVRGWLDLKQTSFSDEIDVTFNLTISSNVSLPLHAEWFISDIPIIYGEESCALIGSEKYMHSKLANFSVKSHNVFESALVKGVSLLDIADRALVLKFNQKVETCSNILLNDTKVFVAQFYGPELGGTTYYFLHTSLALLKVYSLVLNANNFDVNLKWSLRKYWWLPRQDSREPSVALCREKSKNAYFWYQPPFENQTEPQYMKPETRQLITVFNCSLARENLARSVLVVDKISTFSWDAKKSSCAKLSAVDDSAQSETCSADGEILILQQASPFHPLRAFHTRTACTRPEPLAPPATALAESRETSLLLHSALAAFATNLRFAHSNVAVVRFFFPFAGELRLEQSRNDSDSYTLVSGSLISLFDESDDTPIAGRLQLLKGATPATLNDMSCLVARDVYNPAAVDDVFCQKAQALCPVGKVPYSVRVAAYNGTVVARQGFRFVARHLPLDGPFSIVGQSLKVSVPNVEACANVSLLSRKSTLLEQRVSKAAGNKTSICDIPAHSILDEMFDPYVSAVVANFQHPLFTGTVYIAQYIEELSHAIPMQNTGLFFAAAGMDAVKNLTVDICDYDYNGTCDQAPIYNPFGVDTDPLIYNSACLSNPLLCALGDVSKKRLRSPSEFSVCFSTLPVRGAFSISNKTLRLSRTVNGQTQSLCTVSKSVNVKETIIRAEKTYNSSQIQSVILDELKAGDLALRVERTKVKKISTKCQAYRISFLGPDAEKFEEIISNQIKNNSGVAKFLNSENCLSTSAGSKAFTPGVMILVILVVVMTVLN